MTPAELIAVLTAFSVSLVMPIVLIPVLRKLSVVDVPNQRSSHSAPVPRGGGLAPLLGFTAGVTITYNWGLQGEDRQVMVILCAAIAVSLVGLWDDLGDVTILVRAGLQVLIGLLATWALVTVYNADLWWVPLGAIAFAGYINAANFMDGINGLSGLHGAAVGIAFALVGVWADVHWLVPMGLVLSATFTAFLPWNIVKSRVFLGDVGSYFLGGSVILIVFGAVLDGVPLVTMIAPLSIYLADTGTTLIKRILRGEQWREAHRFHVYQKLTDAGLSHISVALIVTGASLSTSVVGIVSIEATPFESTLSAFALALIAALYLSLPRLVSTQGPGRDSVTEMSEV